MLMDVERVPEYIPRHQDEPQSELPKEARFALKQTLLEVLANDLATKEKDRSKNKLQRAKKA